VKRRLHVLAATKLYRHGAPGSVERAATFFFVLIVLLAGCAANDAAAPLSVEPTPSKAHRQSEPGGRGEPSDDDGAERRQVGRVELELPLTPLDPQLGPKTIALNTSQAGLVVHLSFMELQSSGAHSSTTGLGAILPGGIQVIGAWEDGTTIVDYTANGGVHIITVPPQPGSWNQFHSTEVPVARDDQTSIAFRIEYGWGLAKVVVTVDELVPVTEDP